MASADILRAAHSDLPFSACRESIYSGETNIAICDMWVATSEIDDANAAFIVRACNAHYQMLEALKAALADIECGGHLSIELINAAIDKAEGQ